MGAPIRLPLALVAAAVLLGACGDDGGGGNDEAGGGDRGDGAAEQTAAEDRALLEEGLGAVEELLPSLLIAAGELGDDSFAEAGWTPGEADECGDPVAVAGTRIASATLGMEVEEVLAVHADPDAAAAALAACHPEGEDVTDRVGGDEARQSGDSFAVRVADVVVTVAIGGDGDPNDPSRPNPLDVAAYAAGKVAGYLEAGAEG